MDIENTIYDILEELTGTDEVKKNPDLELFDEGLLDSLGSVQMLVEIEGRLGVSVPVSEFDRKAWGTPRKIIEQVEALAKK